MNEGHYQIEFTGLAKEQLKSIVRRAVKTDRPARFAAAMRHLLEQLALNPTEIGEPICRLASMKMHIRRVALAPIYLEYGIHFTKPLVIVRRVIGMAGA